MEEIILVDTDVIIDYFNGVNPMADVVEIFIKQNVLGIPSISLFELYAGIEGKKRLDAIDSIIKIATIFPLDGQAAYRAGKIYTFLKKEGNLIGNQDILIAGIALANSLSLLTRNVNHFQNIKDLRLINLKEIV